MNTSLIFDAEMRRLLKAESNETLMFVQNQYDQRKYSFFMGFFDDFLYDYGIISLNSIPEGPNDYFMPYVNCADANIFGEAKGCRNISDKTLPLSSCQKVIARYIYDHLKRLDVSLLKEWKELQQV